MLKHDFVSELSVPSRLSYSKYAFINICWVYFENMGLLGKFWPLNSGIPVGAKSSTRSSTSFCLTKPQSHLQRRKLDGDKCLFSGDSPLAFPNQAQILLLCSQLDFT